LEVLEKEGVALLEKRRIQPVHFDLNANQEVPFFDFLSVVHDGIWHVLYFLQKVFRISLDAPEVRAEEEQNLVFPFAVEGANGEMLGQNEFPVLM